MNPPVTPTCQFFGTELEFTWVPPGVAADVRDIDDHKGVTAEIHFRTVDGRHIDRFSLNLMAPRSKTEVARRLQPMIPGFDCAVAIEQVAETTISRWRAGEPMILATPKYRESDTYALGDMILKEKANLIYGDGGSLKTSIVQAMFLSMSTGRPIIPGTIPVGNIPVGIFDWEEEEDDFRHRLACLMRGAGLRDPGLLHYRSLTPGIHRHVDYIRREIRRLGLRAICIDSFALAAGVEPEKSDSAIRVYAALRELRPMTAAIIHHVNKVERLANGPATPYGSVFIRNMARLAWEARHVNAEEGGPPVITFRCDKFNYGPKHRTRAFRVLYEPGMIRFEEAEVPDAGGHKGVKGLTGRIRAHLQGAGEGTYETIAEAVEANYDVVKSICWRLQKEGVAMIVKPEGGSRHDRIVRWIP